MNKNNFRSVLLIAIMLMAGQVFAQLSKPVKWSFSEKKVSATEVDLIITATIDNGWHLYGMYMEEGGPNPTIITYTPNSDYELVGKTKQKPAPHEKVDEIFDTKVQEFSGTANFIQRIKIKSKTDFEVIIDLEGQACQEDGSCVLVNTDNTFKLKGVNAASPKKKGTTNKVETTTKASAETIQTAENTSATVNNTVITTDNSSTIIDTKPHKKKTTDNSTITPQEKSDSILLGENTLKKNGSLWSIFVLAFGAGMLALLTPCVFPMIPMTVTFFMGGEKDNKAKARMQALVYGFSIIGIYTVIGTIVAITLGPEFAHWLSTHWLPNVLFFAIFMFFAASFLGMFEIVLPSWIVNKADSQVDKGGFLGAFFMAFTLVLVSFSCTGPIVGSILVQSAAGASIEPIIGMFGFSLAFALPFTFFAFFPRMLKKLPKSGGWLNSVKVVLGFIELALGLKFLSVADQTYHWGILDREIYLAFWIIIFFLLGLYFIGKLKFAHDSDLPYLSAPRLMLGVLTFTFVVYLIPGMFGAPLKALSGYLPPQSGHDFDLATIIRSNSGGGHNARETKLCGDVKYSDKFHLPHGLEGYYDYDEALACAKKQNKPLFIDFTGHGCVNCREMEANVWSDPQVLKRLQEDYIIVALYVDDKTDLPEEEWTTSTFDHKVKKTIGKKYADFQITNFGVNAQPYYVLLDTNGKPLVTPHNYDKNVKKFVDFLDKGLIEFKNRNK